MDLPATMFHIHCQAMAYAMQTADRGEPVSAILVRATMIANFMAEPLTAKSMSDAMGQPATTVVQ